MLRVEIAKLPDEFTSLQRFDLLWLRLVYINELLIHIEVFEKLSVDRFEVTFRLINFPHPSLTIQPLLLFLFLFALEFRYVTWFGLCLRMALLLSHGLCGSSLVYDFDDLRVIIWGLCYKGHLLIPCAWKTRFLGICGLTSSMGGLFINAFSHIIFINQSFLASQRQIINIDTANKDYIGVSSLFAQVSLFRLALTISGLQLAEAQMLLRLLQIHLISPLYNLYLYFL